MKTKHAIIILSFSCLCGVVADEIGNTDPCKGPLEITITYNETANVIYDAVHNNQAYQATKEVSGDILKIAEERHKVAKGQYEEIKQKKIAENDLLEKKLEKLKKEQADIQRKLSSTQKKMNYVERLEAQKTYNAYQKEIKDILSQQNKNKNVIKNCEKAVDFLKKEADKLGKAGKWIERGTLIAEGVIDFTKGVVEKDDHQKAKGLANLSLIPYDIFAGSASLYLMAGVGLIELATIREGGIDPLDIDQFLNDSLAQGDQNRKVMQDWLIARWEKGLDMWDGKSGGIDIKSITCESKEEDKKDEPKPVKINKHSVY